MILEQNNVHQIKFPFDQFVTTMMANQDNCKNLTESKLKEEKKN